MKRYIKSTSKVYAWVCPDDVESQLAVARDGDWKAYNWEPEAWGKLVGYDKTTKLYSVQWDDGSITQHSEYGLMTGEQVNDRNRRYWEGE